MFLYLFLLVPLVHFYYNWMTGNVGLAKEDGQSKLTCPQCPPPQIEAEDSLRNNLPPALLQLLQENGDIMTCFLKMGHSKDCCWDMVMHSLRTVFSVQSDAQSSQATTARSFSA
jgi:hypothetical protein